MSDKEWPPEYVRVVAEAQQPEVAWNDWGLPSSMGPGESYNEQSKINPCWWKGRGEWSCVHAAKPGECGKRSPRFRNAIVGDGSCGLGPDDPNITYTEEDLANIARSLESMLHEMESQ
jgi:hypothetical protein